MKQFSLGARILGGATGVSATLFVGGLDKEKYQEYFGFNDSATNLASKARLAFGQMFQLKAEATISTIEKLAINSEKYLEEKPDVIFVLGGPGSGKGTQCAKISSKFGHVHLSAGDLLRAERASPESKFGEIIQKNLKNGTLVPTSITCALLERAMSESDESKFLIDGFPRGEENLQVWNEDMGEKVSLQCVLFFQCSQEVCTKRCLARGAAGSGRSDDNLESLKKRFETYEQATMPIIEQFQEQNLVRRIDASASPEEVFAEVEIIINGLK